jgi:hypothetical protein
VFESTAREFIEKAILRDKEFLARFDPQRDLAAFEAAWQARRMGASGEVGAFEPNYEGSPAVWGTAGAACGALGRHTFAARPGHHLAPLILAGRNLFAELSNGFTLLNLGAEAAASDGFARAAQELGIPLKVIQAGIDPDGTYGATSILVRPDQFVAWTSACAPADPNAVLAKAAGRPDPVRA